MSFGNNTNAFLALVRAGLWEKEARLLEFNKIDFNVIYRLAEEQSVVGIVAAGIEHVVGNRAPQEVALQFAGRTLQLEQRNQLMNGFVAELIKRLRKEEIYCLLVKGQGIAQCYERPLWRSAGDIDLLLCDSNYKRAKAALMSIASEVANEDEATKHQALIINGFDVELHGKMPFIISKRVDKGIDAVLNDIFCGGSIRLWVCNGTQVFLPSPDNDVILVFTHFLHHFFIEGVGLRQICDWCRLLWVYKDSLNQGLLKSRIQKMGLMREWKVFASLAVDSLGMPVETMPFYDKRYRRKGDMTLSHILKTGNLGHNTNQKYRSKYSKPLANTITFFRRIGDFTKFTIIFPIDSPKFFMTYLTNRIKTA